MNFIKTFALTLTTNLFFLTSCVVGFSNRENHISPEYKNVYIPAANDASVFSGNSSRISQSVRSLLAMRSDLHFTKLENARWALQIKVLDRKQSIAVVDTCSNPGTPNVASGAYSCSVIHPELTSSNTNLPMSFNQPYVSPNTESLSLVVLVKAIDLNSGKTLWAKTYSASNIPPIVFDEIGDVGDGRTKIYLQNTPDLHALRYQEAVDNAVQAFGTAIATDVQAMVFSVKPPPS